MNAHPKELDFLISALTEHNPFLETEDFTDWFSSRQQAHAFRIDRIPFSDLREWYFDPSTGNLRHRSGRFFSIEGIRVRTDFGAVPEWTQPIISQPEVGILGILAKKFDGILYFLMQAKMEPGNINTVQLAPTLQATRSNYTRVHGGRTPPYLEYFVDKRDSRVLVDTLQSEQGARFLRKRNRNIVIETTKEVPLSDDFRWLTLGQLQKLVRYDHIVNMDARTVFCASPLRAQLGGRHSRPVGPRIGRLATIDASLLRAERSQFQSRRHRVGSRPMGICTTRTRSSAGLPSSRPGTT
jgi:oxidase EvaA